MHHVCVIHEALGTFKELADLCTRILEKDRHCQAVREVRALANHMAGDMAAFEKDVEIMRRVPGWRPKKLALAKIVPAVGRPKGKNRATARK
ncbi:g4261 [Coccomyxa viridis]|uniref:G4261 protein n=1 Tax=Coccomyxa viridis TaxID=1274662 RepID=A0ABP1FPX1_9CHLO